MKSYNVVTHKNNYRSEPELSFIHDIEPIFFFCHCQGVRSTHCSEENPKDPGTIQQDWGRVTDQKVDRDPGPRHGQTTGPDQPRNRSVNDLIICLCLILSIS